MLKSTQRCSPAHTPSLCLIGVTFPNTLHLQITRKPISHHFPNPSDCLRSANIARLDDVIQVVAHGNKQVEEELAASRSIHVATALFHLGLHGAAALEGLAAPDDERQVMGAQAAVRVGGVGVAVLGAAQHGAYVDARVQPLFAQRQLLELLQPITPRGTVDDGVAEDVLADARYIDGRLDSGRDLGGLACAATSEFKCIGKRRGILDGGPTRERILELPRVAVLVVHQAGVVVALVEVLEDGAEDLRLLIGERDPPVLRIRNGPAQDPVEERSLAQHILMRRKQPCLGAHHHGDDGRGGKVLLADLRLGRRWTRSVLAS